MKLKAAILFSLVFFSVASVSASSHYLDKKEWSQTPTYFQDSSVEVRFSDVIEEKESYQACSEYKNRTYDNGTEYRDCLSYTTEFYGGQNTYIFGIENIDYWYIGNGKVRLEFDVVRNDLTKELFQSKKNPVQESKFIDYFNTNYLFRDEVIDSSSYDTLLDYTESVRVSSLGDSLRAKTLEDKNLMASSNSRVETVIELEDFRNGGAKINDAVTVEVVS